MYPIRSTSHRITCPGSARRSGDTPQIQVFEGRCDILTTGGKGGKVTGVMSILPSGVISPLRRGKAGGSLRSPLRRGKAGGSLRSPLRRGEAGGFCKEGI